MKKLPTMVFEGFSMKVSFAEARLRRLGLSTSSPTLGGAVSAFVAVFFTRS